MLKTHSQRLRFACPSSTAAACHPILASLQCAKKTQRHLLFSHPRYLIRLHTESHRILIALRPGICIRAFQVHSKKAEFGSARDQRRDAKQRSRRHQSIPCRAAASTTRVGAASKYSASSWAALTALAWVLEYLEGGTVYDYLKQYAPLPHTRLCDFHNQLLDALTHMHAFGLSHGDLSLLNVQVVERFGVLTLKLIDFGRSVSADSVLAHPDVDPVDPWSHANNDRPDPRVEQYSSGHASFLRTGDFARGVP